MTRLLVADLGKTGCRAVLHDGDVASPPVQVAGPRGLADPGGASHAGLALAHATRLLTDDATGLIDVVSVGAAGLGRGLERAPALIDVLVAHFPNAELVLASDMTTSHIGALDGHPGVVLAAGTGAVALAVSANSHAVSDGWGYLVGDDGSGFAIGRAGIKAALRHHDHRQESGILHSLAVLRYGPLETLPTTLHGSENPAATIAAFSHEVAEAALAGDQLAISIMASAGRDLALTTTTAARQVFGNRPHCDVAVVGGLFSSGEVLTDPFTAALDEMTPTLTVRTAAGTSLDGAARMARDNRLPHEHLIRRRPARQLLDTTR